jgi:hypothetical protein
VFVIFDVTIRVCDFMICTLIYFIKMIENFDKSDANNVIS